MEGPKELICRIGKKQQAPSYPSHHNMLTKGPLWD